MEEPRLEYNARGSRCVRSQKTQRPSEAASLSSSLKRVARRDAARIQPAPEPAHPLRRCPVRKRLRRHTAGKSKRKGSGTRNLQQRLQWIETRKVRDRSQHLAVL